MHHDDGSTEQKEREHNKQDEQFSRYDKDVNTLLNIKAFLLVARTGSFSGAARELGVAPSVVTKRISRLEEEMGAQLFLRSTRGLNLTDAGEKLLPRYQGLVAELDEIISGAGAPERGIEGHLRIKSPTTITSLYLGTLFAEFQVRHPGVGIEIVLLDRSVNPLEEGFDVVIAARPASYPHVIDVPLCEYRLALCCTPAYLESRGRPEQPSDLIEHDCLTSVLLGSSWLFETERGAVSVEIHSHFHANDGRVVLEAARRGLGIAALPRYLADADLRSGRLVSVLDGYPPAGFWLKALVPRMKIGKPAVSALVNFLKSEMQPVPPWERQG
jgi:DNA-binding transcriptional LysR family regulator